MKTVEEINELAYKRYGCDPHSYGGQRDGFKEGFKLAQEMQLLQSCVSSGFCKCDENVPVDIVCQECHKKVEC